jgi:hypothetical protein
VMTQGTTSNVAADRMDWLLIMTAAMAAPESGHVLLERRLQLKAVGKQCLAAHNVEPKART